ncbi:MAG: NmrA/HSCARG family protein [Anaerolineae bacterium]
MNEKTILVIGATGRTGGAALRHLRQRGWQVRAMTRTPDSDSAQALRAQGVPIVQGNMDDPDSLRAAFEGVYGVFLVVNGWEAGYEGEIRQGKHVADVAAEMGIQHVVFSVAGTGERNTGIPHFESKLTIIDYMRERQLPLTVIYPGPYMELLTDEAFFPQVTVWHAKARVLGTDYRVPWTATDDIGLVAAEAFDHPAEYLGKQITVIGDWKTLDEVRQIYREVTGANPRRWFMPLWLYRRMQPDLMKMWEWMHTHDMKQVGDQEGMTVFAGPTDIRTFLIRHFEPALQPSS